MRELPLLNYQVSGPEGEPWVTFIPGIGNDATFWACQAGRLASCCRVLVFDPWGHAGSPPPPENCQFADIVDGVVQLWDHLGIKRSSLVGLGFGGSTALALALKYPQRVESLVACCCRGRQPENRRAFWEDRLTQARVAGLAELADVTVDRWLSEAFRAERPEVDRCLREMIKRTSVEGYCAYVQAFIEMNLDAQLEQIGVPSLLIAAEHDHGGGPVGDMQKMSERMPDARLAVVSDSGHICNHERPEEVALLLEEFLALGGKN